MKKILLIFALLLLVFCFIEETQAQERQWSYVSSTAQGDAYIDKDIKLYSNNIVGVWVKLILPNRTHTTAFTEFDCAQKQYRNTQIILYNEIGTVVNTSNGSKVWKATVPDTLNELIQNTSCSLASQKLTEKKAVRKSGLAEIISKNANLRESPDISSPVVREVALGEKLVLADAEAVGAWYKVIDPKTRSEGWLHGNTFKVVPIEKKKPKSKRTKKN